MSRKRGYDQIEDMDKTHFNPIKRVNNFDFINIPPNEIIKYEDDFSIYFMNSWKEYIDKWYKYKNFGFVILICDEFNLRDANYYIMSKLTKEEYFKSMGNFHLEGNVIILDVIRNGYIDIMNLTTFLEKNDNENESIRIIQNNLNLLTDENKDWFYNLYFSADRVTIVKYLFDINYFTDLDYKIILLDSFSRHKLETFTLMCLMNRPIINMGYNPDLEYSSANMAYNTLEHWIIKLKLYKHLDLIYKLPISEDSKQFIYNEALNYLVFEEIESVPQYSNLYKIKVNMNEFWGISILLIKYENGINEMLFIDNIEYVTTVTRPNFNNLIEKSEVYINDNKLLYIKINDKLISFERLFKKYEQQYDRVVHIKPKFINDSILNGMYIQYHM